MISFFFFNDTATTEIYTLSLHDALPIYVRPLRAVGTRRRIRRSLARLQTARANQGGVGAGRNGAGGRRSEEHTSELQSRQYPVCRLLLEKKIKRTNCISSTTAARAWTSS